ncbi:MAG: serine hydrolase domain-containing protein [Alphaproteobacteria bacterium]|mgnify:CR=1 FL=1|nr:serine hydrolase domain-containing protein [Alphaproteobacteria bacterium]
MSDLEARLQAILDAYVAKGITGVSAALRIPGRDADILLASGIADRRSGAAMTPEHSFRIGSCTKTFVAAALHQLVQEGVVDLDEPVTRWFPDMPRANELPVRILLNHRSGLPEFENHMPMISNKQWAPREIVDFAFESTPQRDPWGEMEYNNTGYILAGIIISLEAGGETLSQQLRKRLFVPLGLDDTYCGTDESYPEDQVARAYMHVEEQSGQWDIEGAGEPVDGVWDATDWFPLSGAGAAGDMVSTARDLTHWMDSLFSGKVLGQKAFDEMANNLNPASFPGSHLIQNGHGILVSKTGGVIMKGHLGQIPGHATVMGHQEASGISAALIQNSAAGDFESFYLTGVHQPFADLFSAAAAH